jgi:hypothetical protein
MSASARQTDPAETAAWMLNLCGFCVIIYTIVYGVLSETLPHQQTRISTPDTIVWTKPHRRLWGLNPGAVSPGTLGHSRRCGANAIWKWPCGGNACREASSKHIGGRAGAVVVFLGAEHQPSALGERGRVATH